MTDPQPPMDDEEREVAEEDLRRLAAQIVDLIEYCYGGLPDGRDEIAVARIKLGELVFWTASALHNTPRIER